jgi:hypothetical protein
MRRKEEEKYLQGKQNLQTLGTSQLSNTLLDLEAMRAILGIVERPLGDVHQRSLHLFFCLHQRGHEERDVAGGAVLGDGSVELETFDGKSKILLDKNGNE